ncbi:hypothetical protein [Pilimelia columellifera]|uniref:Lipoprotein n=1 Tax=Pilimelia columellifera subsp. columellifera TaxID=706583 RepID=A0ABP6AVE4_9ACTN
MPIDPEPPAAHRPTGTGRWLVVLAVGATLTAGCRPVADADRGFDQAQLVNTLASRVAVGEQRDHTAEYQALGGPAWVTRQATPPRTVYRHPDGLLMVDRKATTECDAGAAVTCRRSLPPTGGANPRADLFDEPGATALVPPRLVISLLTAAAMDPSATIEQGRSSVAGEPATCVRASGLTGAPAPGFAACLTDGGVLASFDATVNGRTLSIRLSRLTDRADVARFALPAGSVVVDERPPGAR